MALERSRTILATLALGLAMSCTKGQDDQKTNQNPNQAGDPSLPSHFASGSALLEQLCGSADGSASASMASDVRKDVAQFAQNLSQKAFNGQENAVLSPLSVQFAFAMLRSGAAGATQSQIADALRLGSLGYDVDQAFKFLSTDLRCPHAAPADATLADVGLHLANAVWGAKSTPLADTYTKFVRDTYGAEAQTLDFAESPVAAVDAINAWSKEATFGKIASVLQPSDVGEATSFIITNAIHYKANWKYPFNKEATQESSFAVLGQETKPVPTMHASSLKTQYLDGSDFEAIRLDYSDGDAMILVRPRTPTGLPKLLEHLELETLISQAGWQEAFATLALPKFKIDFNQSLVEPLRQLGLTTAFSEDADFGAMLAQPSKVRLSDVFQKAYIDVHEEGTEAAAVTVAIGENTSAPMDPLKIEINFDHPFFYAIERRGAVLFTGTVVDPSK